MRRALVFLLLSTLAGCTLDTFRSRPLDAQAQQAAAPSANPNVGDPAILTYNPALNVDLSAMTKTATGLYYRDLTAGTGAQAVAGSRVEVHYTGWLADGTEFDSSKRTGQPISFTLGRKQVIDGWEEGLSGMRAGGTRMLVIPPSLAYGEGGAAGVIPGHATLVFVVQLVEVRGE